MESNRRNSLRIILGTSGFLLAGCLGSTNNPGTQITEDDPPETDTPESYETGATVKTTGTTIKTTGRNETTQTPKECTASPPTPDQSEINVQPSEYPECPSSIDGDQSEQFILEFDRAYHRNEFIIDQSQNSPNNLNFVNINDHSIIRNVDIDNGLVIGVNGWLAAGEPTTMTEDGEVKTDEKEYDLRYGSWYYLNAYHLGYVEAADQINSNSNLPALDQFSTVYCP